MHVLLPPTGPRPALRRTRGRRARTAPLGALGLLLALGGCSFATEVHDLTPRDRLEGGPSQVAPRDPVRPARAAGGTGGPRVDPAWVQRTARSTGIPAPAVRAYGQASLTAPPGCRLGWTTLAGIGWIESQHGQIGDRRLLDSGLSSRRILGPALDGSGNFAAIRATRESTAWHGNPDWDHAVGPMQFIHDTWRRWARDGDGDGVANPHDLDDAAASAAAYLCVGEQDLASPAGWTAAIFSYNHDDVYVHSVWGAATRYGTAAG